MNITLLKTPEYSKMMNCISIKGKKRTQLAEEAPTHQIWSNLSIKKNELLDYNNSN